MTVYEELKKVCQVQNCYSAKQIIDLVEKEFDRNRTSIVPADYCYNRINKGIPFSKHIFIFAEEKYRFVGEDYLYSGAITHTPREKVQNERVVGLWENGKFYLWEDFPKVSKENSKRTSRELVALIDFAEHEFALLNQVESSLSGTTSARQARLLEATKIPAKVAVVTQAYLRNPDVIAEVLFRAKGRCEGCGNQAPFRRRKNGEFYLEVHHKKQLANGGEDSVENAIALCPNCHRERHFGQ